MEHSDTTFPCTPPNTKFVCSPTEVNTNRKLNLNHTPQNMEIRENLNELCKEYKDTDILHQYDTGHPKLLTKDIDTGDHPPITQKP